MSIGWANDDLGNAMLGLDQKDTALDHLILYSGNVWQRESLASRPLFTKL